MGCVGQDRPHTAIKSTVFLGPGMSGALASPMLCSGKHEAHVQLRITAQDEQWHDESCGSAQRGSPGGCHGGSQCMPSAIQVGAQGGSDTHPFLLSTFFIPKPDLNNAQAAAEALLSWVQLSTPHVAPDTHPGFGNQAT